jgi:hypothetical protein
VAQATLNNGHTDIKKSAMTAVRVKTNPLLIFLPRMFFLFLSGFLRVKAGFPEKTFNARSKKFCCSEAEDRPGQDEQDFSGST